MASISALQNVYREEFIKGFDKTESVLRDTVTTEYMSKGGAAIFLVSDTINMYAQSRGVNGLIPANPLALTQNTATLVPWHRLETASDFNIFISQGNLPEMLRVAVMAALNRQVDNDIILGLDTSTTVISAGGPMTIATATKAQGILGANKVPDDDQLTFLITPAARTYLMQTTEFTNSLYVEEKPYADGGLPIFNNKKQVYRWAGVKVIVDPTLPGAGTSAAHCYMYHKNAIGQAINKQEIEYFTGFNEEQGYSYAKATMFMGTKVLQTNGIVVITHDDSAIVSG